MKINLTRKQFLLGGLAGAGMLLSGLPAFAVTDADFQSANIDWKQFKGENVKVLLTRHPWQEAIEPLIPQFESLTGIKVDLRKLPEKQFLTKVPADLTAGTFKFDVFMTQIYEAPKYAQEHWVAEIKQYMDDPKLTDASWYDWNDFFPGAQQAAVMGNTPFANLAVTAESQLLIYRKDVLSELGIEVPKTFDELLAAAKTISDSGKMNGITVRGGPALWWPLYGVVSSYGGDYLDADLKVALDRPETVKAIQMYADLAKYAPKGVTNYDWDEINTAMLSSQAAMFIDASVIYPRLVDPKLSTIGDKIGVAPFPAGPAGPHSNSQYWTISMSNSTVNKPAAWLFMQWATSKPVQAELARGGVLGARASSWEQPELKEKFGADFIDSVQTTLKTAVLTRANVSFLQLVDALRQGVQKTILNEKSAEDAMKDAASVWRKALNQ